jgi:transposase-like protein
LPDETFFSLASRHHALAGHRLPEHTSLALFGRRRWGYQHDFPSPLDAFVERTAGQLGSTDEIAQAHTILPFFLAARNEAASQDARLALAQVQAGSLKFRLGLLTSRFRAHHPLKACPACSQEDAATHGWTYWHRTHQFPGVWMCLRHALPLQVSSLKSTGVSRFGWMLPHSADLNPTAVVSADDSSREALQRFSGLAAQWGVLPNGSLESSILARTYRTRLEDMGLSGHRVKLASAYCEAIAALRIAPDLCALPGQGREAVHSINRWVFAPQEATHPLRHLSFIYWLFRSWDDFTKAYAREAAAGVPTVATDSPAGVQFDARKASLIEGIAGGRSVSSLARELGSAVQTAQAWAANAGMSTPKRAKQLKDVRYTALLQDLRCGGDKATLAKKYGISVETVTRVLRTEVGLSTAWRQARWHAAQNDARALWTEALVQFRHLGLNVARNQEAAAYAWLYRNDRAWLLEINQTIKRPPPNPGPRLDWDQRDLELAEAVHQAAADLWAQKRTVGAPARLRVGELCQRLPELKAKLSALNRLPLTLKAIQDITNSPRRFLAESSERLV